MNIETAPNQLSTEPPPHSSLPVRLANVFAAPGEVFDGLRGQPAAVTNWLVPATLAAVVGMISVWVMFSQPAILQQLEDMQTQRYEQLVADGKLTQEQADQIQKQMGDFQMTIGRIAGTVGALFATFAWLFLLALVFFLMMRWFFHAPLPYMKIVEVVGLSQMIGVLGGLVTTLLMVITGSMFSNLGPVLLLSDFDSANKLHLLASSVNVFTIWWLGVLALGLARVSDRSFATLALTLYGLWAALRLIIVYSGLGSGGM
jgi:hypothetical protein